MLRLTRLYVVTAIFSVLLSFASALFAADDITVTTKEESELNATIGILNSILDTKSSLKKMKANLQRQLDAAQTESEKSYLKEKIATIEKKLRTIDTNFEEIATDTDLSILNPPLKEEFNLEKEIISLIKPTLEEMNHMTQSVRKKSELRERLKAYKKRQNNILGAIEHLTVLIDNLKGEKILRKALKQNLDYWERQQKFIESQQQSATLQLKKLVAADVSFAESTQTYFKEFFQKRGFYLFQALLVILLILLLSHYFRCFLEKFVVGFTHRHRSFRMRLFDLLHRAITLNLLIVGPMLVFYFAEDWVLFTLSLLLLIGVTWALRTTIPHYWSQIQLFLNIGAVREGERIFLDGLPWRVNTINLFSILENPVANLKQRIPIEDLVHLKSRPYTSDEPWFPCSKGDWIILSDGIRGKVIGISLEMIKLVQRGGAHKTYLTSEFLSLSPLNLAVNFRIKETIGISYDHQSSSTNEIPDILLKTIEQRIKDEGYSDDLLNLRVEFEYANTSALDLVVIADFKGYRGDLYNRLRRAIQRWCVDACTENQWEIPFTQITLHGGLK